jgi:hypothetical protein
VKLVDLLIFASFLVFLLSVSTCIVGTCIDPGIYRFVGLHPWLVYPVIFPVTFISGLVFCGTLSQRLADLKSEDK